MSSVTGELKMALDLLATVTALAYVVLMIVWLIRAKRGRRVSRAYRFGVIGTACVTALGYACDGRYWFPAASFAACALMDIAGAFMYRPLAIRNADGSFTVRMEMRPPPRWLRRWRRWRHPDGVWPMMSSEPWWSKWFAAVVPYRLRWAHRWYARRSRYFWLPCPLCGRPFGGHEWRLVDGRPASVPNSSGTPVGICPRCTAAGRGVDVVLREDLS